MTVSSSQAPQKACLVVGPTSLEKWQFSLIQTPGTIFSPITESKNSSTLSNPSSRAVFSSLRCLMISSTLQLP